MNSYLVTYKRKRGREEVLIELPSIEKLLKWIEENTTRCRWVHITVVEG